MNGTMPVGTAPLVVVGFGPAGIAIAACLRDAERQGTLAEPGLARDTAYFEKAPTSAWQPGMVLPGTDIQHHFLRDFATPRDPDSPFTFVKFLFAEDRFYPFTLRGGYVTREEWSKYCQWVAGKTESTVHYGYQGIAVEPVHDSDGALESVIVVARHTGTGQMKRVQTQRVILATGHEPHVPETFQSSLGDRVFHSSQFSWRWEELKDSAARVAVIGGGQNGGETLLHLFHSTNAELYSIVRNSGLRLYDLGHFANQAYWPPETDYFHSLEPEQQRTIFAEQHRTNYAAVDPDVSTGLYNAWYDDRVRGERRLNMVKRTCVEGITHKDGAVALDLREIYTDETRELDVDAVVLCTGFREPAVPEILAPLRQHLTVAKDGCLTVERDFRTPLRASRSVDIYLNGMSERRHGIASATSFSLLAHRAGEILESITEHTTTQAFKEQVHARI